MENIQKIKARLLANTRQKGKGRVDNLFDIANFIDALKNHYGSLKIVSEEVADISPDMLNRFLSALKVDKRIFPLIKSRKIDNINVLFYIHKLKPDEQIYLANLVAENKINSTDIRAIAPLKKKFPDKSIKEICDLVLDSKDKKRYLIKFDITEKTEINSITKKLKKIISSSDFKIEKSGKIGTVILSQHGYNSIKEHCENENIKYENLIKSIIF
jgi:hypothetical protein